MFEYKIVTTTSEFKFIGRHRRDLESKNWHYYEQPDGEIIHFRKEHLVAVIGGRAETIDQKKQSLFEAAIKTLKDNLDLCDGNICTLKDLRDDVEAVEENWFA